MVRVVQWLENRKMMGGTTPKREDARMTRFLPNLSASIPPGNMRSRFETAWRVARPPITLFEPSSSRMYKPQNGFQRKDANMRMLWLRVTAMRFLLNSASLREDPKMNRWRASFIG